MARNVSSLSVLIGTLCAIFTAAVHADFKDDIGFTQLQSELGASTPDGEGVTVGHVEGRPSGGFIVDYNNDPEWVNTQIDYPTGIPAYGSGSDHVVASARYFVGNVTSIASGVTHLISYTINPWSIAYPFQPNGHINSVLKTPGWNTSLGGGLLPGTDSSRVGNHAYIESVSSEFLRRLDWYIATDEAIEFVTMENDVLNGSTPSGGLPIAFNHITVGRSTGENGTGANTELRWANSSESVYLPGHPRPTILAPGVSTSLATPIAASVAVLLVQTGHDDPDLSTDPVVQNFTNRAGSLIRNAERSEVIKAAVMAGADRTARFTDSVDTNGDGINDANAPAYMPPYRDNATHQTDNGLDTRLGAGQINVRNSYYIIAAGEQNSSQDGGPPMGPVAERGFDYDPSFSGLNPAATYLLPVKGTPQLLTASLVWNISVVAGTEAAPDTFDGTTTLDDLDVTLLDETEIGDPVVVATSNTTVENTENLWILLQANHLYALHVNRGNGSPAVEWDYGLAWQMLQDSDSDGAPDEKDNCINVVNGPINWVGAGSTQLDADNDGYGNRCDGDLNNNGVTNAQDYAIFRTKLGTADPVADLNGNSTVNAQDYAIFRTLLGAPPGPSAYGP